MIPFYEGPEGSLLSLLLVIVTPGEVFSYVFGEL